jgi:hypothetical protein
MPRPSSSAGSRRWPISITPCSLHPPDRIEAELTRERELGRKQGFTPVIIAPGLWNSTEIAAAKRTRNAQQLLAEDGAAYNAAFGRELLAGTLEAFADGLPHNPDPALFDALQPVEAKPQGNGLQLLRKVAEAAIMRIPTTESHTIPVYLGWGGWNAMVPSDLEICAVSRHWGETYGAELVAVGADALEFSVARKPADHAAAVQLLREHCCFAPDGLAFKKDELERAAALLRVADTWTFWWDCGD